MENFSKEEFDEWKFHPVTMLFLSRLKQEAEQVMLGLAQDAGENSLNDRYRVGRIHTLIEISNVDYEELNEGN